MNEDTQNQAQDQEEETPEETVDLLERYKRHFTGLYNHYRGRAERIEMLKNRRGAKKWSEKKRNKMQRRHAFAVSAAFEVEQLLDQINVRLQQRAQYDPWVDAEG